ncbi:MAG: hypothetical protein L0H93_20165, partial [Nocardioides sp.]|nr:hypothetical protein [Nocardioides sp.]
PSHLVALGQDVAWDTPAAYGGGMNTHEQKFDNRESNPNGAGPDRLAGGMGVSSEREGVTGPGQSGTDGERETHEPEPEGESPPEQAPGNEETNPVGIPPKPHHPDHNPGHSAG